MILIDFDRELPTTLCEAMLPLEYKRPTRRDAENLDEMIGEYVRMTDHTEAAMCLWEAVLENNLFAEFRDAHGTVELRNKIASIAPIADRLYQAHDWEGRGLDTFDWDWIPWFLKNFVDDEFIIVDEDKFGEFMEPADTELEQAQRQFDENPTSATAACLMQMAADGDAMFNAFATVREWLANRTVEDLIKELGTLAGVSVGTGPGYWRLYVTASE